MLLASFFLALLHLFGIGLLLVGLRRGGWWLVGGLVGALVVGGLVWYWLWEALVGAVVQGADLTPERAFSDTLPVWGVAGLGWLAVVAVARRGWPRLLAGGLQGALALALGLAGPLLGWEYGQKFAGVQTQLQRQETTWQTVGIKNYRFTLALHCNCPALNPVTLVVRGGESQFETPPDEDTVALYAPYLTIDALFQRLHTAIDERYAAIEATYDPVLGFPNHIYLTPHFDAPEGDVELEVLDFQGLP